MTMTMMAICAHGVSKARLGARVERVVGLERWGRGSTYHP